MCRAICAIASSQVISSHLSEPGRRTLGTVSRFGLLMSSRNVAPLGQSVPRLIGWSGSPSTCTTAAFTFFALSPSVWMITPQETAQYGQVLLVSVVRAIFNSRISARACLRSNPSATAPPTAAAEPFRKVLRFTGWLLVGKTRRKACSGAAHFVNIRGLFALYRSDGTCDKSSPYIVENETRVLSTTQAAMPAAARPLSPSPPRP